MTPAEYVCELYEPGDRVATVLIQQDAGAGCDGEPPKAEQRVWPTCSASSDMVQAWLRHLNASKYDAFVEMNPMRPLTRVWLDIAEEGPKRLERILGDALRGRIGMPGWALGTSPGRVRRPRTL